MSSNNPLERFKDLTVGQMAAVCQKVAAAGGGGDDVIKHLLREDLLVAVVEKKAVKVNEVLATAIYRKVEFLCRRSRLDIRDIIESKAVITAEAGNFGELFTQTWEQVRVLLDINEHIWKDPAITEGAIRALGDPPDCPKSDEHGLFCVCLFYETGDVAKTFERNWQACQFMLGRIRTSKTMNAPFTSECIRQRSGATPRRPGLRWQVVELGRKFFGQSVAEVRRQLKTMGLGQEGPLVAALHPLWALSLDDSNENPTIPRIIMVDLGVARDNHDGECPRPYACEEYAPDLGYTQGRVYLYGSRVDQEYYRGCGLLL